MNQDANRWASLAAGIVLAGGLSRRMGGGDKCLIALGGQPMLGRVIARLEPQVSAMALNANGDPARFAAFTLPVVADGVDGFAGPLAGVLAGMEWAIANAPRARWVVTAASDTPFFPQDLVDRFVAAAGHADDMIALASSGGRVHPVFGLWPVALAGDLRQWLETGETRKVLAWVGRHQMAEVNFGGLAAGGETIDPFFNINTPEDIEIAEAVFQELTA